MNKLIAWNERIAMWSVTRVATMTCAYVFALIALIALPQAIHDSLQAGPLPLVTWLSQSFLQLVLLSIVMVGQTIQARDSERRAVEQYNAVMEMLQDMRDEHTERHEILEDVRALVQQLHYS
jgi:DNA integrity scanning protein DisA with diadenylate cyclase activity